MRVLVLGGTGFIGRHAALAIRRRGHEVRIGTRDPRRAPRRLPPELIACELVEVHSERLLARADWHLPLAGCDVVVNAIGILRPRGAATYDRVHRRAPAALAAACALTGRRLIHISALGLRNPVRSSFLTSKLAGEDAVAASGAPYSIVRPSLLEGRGGFGAKWLRAIARLPIHLVPADARGRIAVLDVTDLGEAIAALCERPARKEWTEVELGGSAAPTMAGLLAALRRRRTARRALSIKLPALLARIVSHVCDAVRFSPFSFGHLELLRYDNVPKTNLLPRLIGRESSPLAIAAGEIVDAPPVALRRPAF